jgi:hypothetical protein
MLAETRAKISLRLFWEQFGRRGSTAYLGKAARFRAQPFWTNWEK